MNLALSKKTKTPPVLAGLIKSEYARCASITHSKLNAGWDNWDKWASNWNEWTREGVPWGDWRQGAAGRNRHPNQIPLQNYIL